MQQLSIVKKASLGFALAAGITLAALPGLASADEGKRSTDGSDASKAAPVHFDTHELETVEFTFQRIDHH